MAIMNGKSDSKTVVSVSRRTDIPAFYSDWFFKRLQEGFAGTRNPMNPMQVGKVSLRREDVRCFVFWTRNPERMLSKLHLLDGYPFYFQYTLNPYDSRLEPGIPARPDAIRTFKSLSGKIGPDRVIWRYDPILMNSELDEEWHVRHFDELAAELCKYTEKCVLSFVDYYKKIDRCFRENALAEPDLERKRGLLRGFKMIADKYNLRLETCSEEMELADLGIGQAHCIDPVLIEKLSGEPFKAGKDRNQRKACGCCPSVDIGTYNTCMHGCVYCYANHSPESVKRNIANYDADSPVLCGSLPAYEQSKHEQNKQ